MQTRTVDTAQAHRIGYKILFSVCSSPKDVAAKIDGVAISPDVAECEEAAAAKRWDATEPLHDVVNAAASWMAEVVVDDVSTVDDTPELREDLKDEFAQDFATFGVALLGLMLEEGYVVAG